MKNLNSRKVRSIFMLGGVVAMMGATMMVSQPAHADKAKTLKYGAAALGILGAVLAVKGKTLPAVIAGAGAYYAYEKGKDAQNEERDKNRYHDRYNGYYQNDNNRYGNYNSNGYYGDRYDNNRNDRRYDSNNYYSGNRYDNNNRNNNYDYRNNNYNNRPYSVR